MPAEIEGIFIPLFVKKAVGFSDLVR